jgi:hypothetical protein
MSVNCIQIRNSAGFCAGGQGLSWDVGRRRRRRRRRSDKHEWWVLLNTEMNLRF